MESNLKIKSLYIHRTLLKYKSQDFELHYWEKKWSEHALNYFVYTHISTHILIYRYLICIDNNNY
jgi:hypothetical protein